MMYSKTNWIIFLSCLEQKKLSSCGIFYLWFVWAIVENLVLFRENPGEFIIAHVEPEYLDHKQNELRLF